MKKIISILLCLLLGNFSALATSNIGNQGNIYSGEIPFRIDINKKQLPLESRLKDYSEGYLYKIKNNNFYPVEIKSIKDNQDPASITEIYSNINTQDTPLNQALCTTVNFIDPDPYNRKGKPPSNGYWEDFLYDNQIFFNYIVAPVFIVVLGIEVAAGMTVTYPYFKVKNSLDRIKDNIINGKIDKEKAKFQVKHLPIAIKPDGSIEMLVLFEKNSNKKIILEISDHNNKLYKIQK